jgi:ribosomal protein L37AE/L43A
LPETKPVWMKIEDLKRKVPRCPYCDSRDLERNNGLVECHHPRRWDLAMRRGSFELSRGTTSMTSTDIAFTRNREKIVRVGPIR